MKNFLLLFLSTFLLMEAGVRAIDPEKEKKCFLTIEREFFQCVERNGIVQALLKFLSPDGGILPRDGHPIIGKESFQRLIRKKSESNLEEKIRLESLGSGMSLSGDLAYVYGRYRLPLKEPGKEDKVKYGYFGSVWKKVADSTWRIGFCVGLFQYKIINKKPVDFLKNMELGKEQSTLVKTELAFSEFSVKHGIAQAFYTFIDDDGIALSANGPPNDKETYKKLMSRTTKPAGERRLQWKPIFTRVSSSGDLGYNYGPYTYTAISPQGEKKSFFGYFFTVWKKQADEGWKFVFDGGNQVSYSESEEPDG